MSSPGNPRQPDRSEQPPELRKVLDPALCDPTGEPPTDWVECAPENQGQPRGLSEDGRLKSGRLAGLTMNRAIWVLSWPILVESMLNWLVGWTDTRLATELGVAQADAIGGAAYIQWFIGLTIMAVGVGSTALISRAIGKGRLAAADAAVGQSVLLQLLIGVMVTGVILLLISPVAAMLNLEPDAREAFEVYLGIIAASVPLMAIVFGGTSCVRGAGDSFRPLIIMLAVNFVNIVVSWTLVGVDLTYVSMHEGEAVRSTLLANPFDFDLGVAGIAIGTVAAHAVGAVLVIGLLASGKSGVRLKRRRLIPHRITLYRLLRLGIPNYLETLGMWLGNFGVLIIVGQLGASMLGQHIVAIRVEAISFMPGFAMGMAAATLAGQYLGAGSSIHARRAIGRCAIIGGVLMGLMGLVFIFLPRLVVGLFSSLPEHMEQTPALLMICGAVQLPFGLMLVMRGGLRGAGDVRAVMAITWVTTYLVRLPAVYLLSGIDITLPNGTVIVNPSPMDLGLVGVWIALCGELVVRFVAFGARYLNGSWVKARV